MNSTRWRHAIRSTSIRRCRTRIGKPQAKRAAPWSSQPGDALQLRKSFSCRPSIVLDGQRIGDGLRQVRRAAGRARWTVVDFHAVGPGRGTVRGEELLSEHRDRCLHLKGTDGTRYGAYAQTNGDAGDGRAASNKGEAVDGDAEIGRSGG